MTNKPDTLPEGRGGASVGRSAEYLELAEGLEHAARVTWRWLSNDETPWEREITLMMVERLSKSARELREMAQPQSLLNQEKPK